MMDSVEEVPPGEHVEDQVARTEQLVSPDSPDVNDIFGDPRMLCRVGDQYQVDIPPLVTEVELLQLLKNPIDEDSVVAVNHLFLIGLPVPIMWINNKSDSTKTELVDCLGAPDSAVKTKSPTEYQNSKMSSIILNNVDSSLRVEPLEFPSDSGIGIEDLHSCKLKVTGDVGLTLPQHQNLKVDKYKGQSYCPLPGSLSNSWSDFEQEIFLLGLYIFGKNLVQVKNFIGSKEMGDVLSFYYGKFYRSDEHRRWSECRKIRSKRCIHGHRIFTGWTQQELLTRLLSRVSEECQNTLLEASRKFGDEKISLEEYVSTLKDNVGMNLFIEAVGIGKGKQDLTGIVMESVKANHVIHPRLEVPVGKACASLTSGDIIRFLKGDFRLSKARANDIFWEAVWPRLLDKGWHSEQPKSRAYVGSKHSFVFLIPGIKKFSRRRLVKGVQYFDSVSDVLNRVASEPMLLELEVEKDKGVQGDGTKVELEKDSRFSHQDRHFLQPEVPKINSDLMFTIVDTSIVVGKEPGTVKTLRSLPINILKGSKPSISRKDCGDHYKQLVDKLDSVGILSNAPTDSGSSDISKCMSDREVCSDSSGSAASELKQEIPSNGSKPTSPQVDYPKDGDGIVSDKNPDQSSRFNDPIHTDILMDIKKEHAGMSDQNPVEVIKCQFSRRRKGDQTNSLAPVTKRRRLSACSQDDAARSTSNVFVGSVMKEKELPLHLGSCNGRGDIFEAGSSIDNVHTGPSAKESTNNSIEDVLANNCFGKMSSPEECLPRTLIDLNLPQLSPDTETIDKCNSKMENSQDYGSMYGEACHQLVDPQKLNISTHVAKAQHQLEDSQALNSSSHLAKAQHQLEDSQALNSSSHMAKAQHPLEDSQALNSSSHVATAEQQPVMARRQSTRNRPLSTKALEALACGFSTTTQEWIDLEPIPEENLKPKPSRRARGKVSTSITTNFSDVTTSGVVQQGKIEECNVMINGPQVLTEGSHELAHACHLEMFSRTNPGAY